MLTLYLPFRGQPRQRPTPAQVEAWLTAVTTSGLARLTSHATPREAARDLRDGPEGAITLAPSLGVGQLFDEDTHEALLPAELTFEQLRLERAPHPTFLPLGDVEMTVSCRACGDPVRPERFERFLRSLHLTPLAEARLPCPSCDGEVGHKGLEFDREVSFASSWLTLEECGSARLNPALVRAWGALLGGPLALIPEQREATLDWAGGDEVTLGGREAEEELLAEGLGGEWGVKPSRAWAARRAGRQRAGAGHERGGRGRGGRGGRGWGDEA